MRPSHETDCGQATSQCYKRSVHKVMAASVHVQKGIERCVEFIYDDVHDAVSQHVDWLMLRTAALFGIQLIPARSALGASSPPHIQSIQIEAL